MKHIMFVTLLILSFNSFAQDTTFVRSLATPGRVSNISTNNNILYARINDSIYKWDNGFIPFAEGKLKYSMAIKGQKELIINHSNHLNNEDYTDLKVLASGLLPGNIVYDITSVTIGNNFYLCYRGIVLEYIINPDIEVFHKGKSVRHVYSVAGLRIVSTYDGIFIDTIFDVFSENKLGSTEYSSGELSKIDSYYYLCQDNLLRYNEIGNKFETWINTEGNPRIRRLFKYENKVYGLFDKAFGQIDLEKRIVTEYYGHAVFTDYEIFDGKLFLSSLDKGLFVFEPDEMKINKINAISSINDLVQNENQLFLGTDDGLFRLNFDKDSLEPVFEGKSVVQMVFYNEDVIFANNDGLTAYTKNGFLPIVENVEFNRMALSIDQHFLYAGSIFGLYTLQLGKLTNLLKTESVRIEDDKSQKEFDVSYLVLIIVISIIFISVIVYFVIRISRKERVVLQSNTVIDAESVVELVRNNKSILSVQDIADNYDTSITQLNRLLKKENTIALTLLKSVKKNIAIEMYEEGKSLDEISKRVGYSIRFVREKLL